MQDETDFLPMGGDAEKNLHELIWGARPDQHRMKSLIFEAWYQVNRTAGTPRDPERLLELAREWAEERIGPAHLQSIVMETLMRCFAVFRGDRELFLELFEEAYTQTLNARSDLMEYLADEGCDG
jgi:hypothetical protein